MGSFWFSAHRIRKYIFHYSASFATLLCTSSPAYSVASAQLMEGLTTSIWGSQLLPPHRPLAGRLLPLLLNLLEVSGCFCCCPCPAVCAQLKELQQQLSIRDSSHSWSHPDMDMLHYPTAFTCVRMFRCSVGPYYIATCDPMALSMYGGP